MSDKLYSKAIQILNKYWSYSDFRSGQDTVVKSVLDGNDTLVLFPTGGGKSICYQVPALVMEGFTLVVSPLVALMQDQVQALKEKGISATFINSSIPKYEIDQRMINARNGMYKLLYVAPERLSNSNFQYELNNLNISLIAIDEAHCISEWGHRFRPSYQLIKEHLSSLSEKVRWMALTATATPDVEKDIIKFLKFKKPTIVRKGYVRENLGYRVENFENKEMRLNSLLKRAKNKGDGLIYGPTRRLCEEIAEQVRDLHIDCEPYHAGFDSKYRENIQKKWISGTIPWVVATNAFGMGIDKPDCKFVFHQSPPNSLEAYYQEAGRAGRDGSDAFPILIYSDSDFRRLEDHLSTAYPTWEELNQIYNAVLDSNSISLGDVNEEAFSLQMADLKKRAHLPSASIKNGLELLAQFDVFEVMHTNSDEIDIAFNWAYPDLLTYINELTNKEKAFFVEQLMRMMHPNNQHKFSRIRWEILVNKINKPKQTILKGLVLLKKEGLINFQQISEQIHVTQLNAREKKVPVIKKVYHKYRNSQFQKLELVKQYVSTKDCRNAFFSAYFGDVLPSNFKCGKCDNCLIQDV